MTSPARASPYPPASRHALIIANDTYQDEGLRQLTSPAQDAEALAAVLGDPQIGGFDVQVVRNEPSHTIATRLDDFFSDRRPGDTLVVHFSCHGLKSESGELYFAAGNTRPRRLASTAVPADFVRRCMSSTRARSVALFLDCCYGGAFPQGAAARASGDVNVLDSFAGDRPGGGRGWAVITASSSMEYAFEGTELTRTSGPRPSVFTSALVSGLATGEADLDQDGRISLDELYDYVFDRVRQENPHQTPSRSVDMQGDLYLARSRRRRIAPSPVPDDVRAAMHSPDLYSRRGAIAELRARMDNPDPAVAAGAREALDEMARRDIRAVADEAARALDEVRVTPRPARLDFGPVPEHAPSPHRPVRLLGPPLARSCAVHVEDDWLRATESSDGLDVSVDTSRPGRRSGDIVLKGAAGEAVVHVEAEVLPTPAPPDRPPAPPDSPPVPPEVPKAPPPHGATRPASPPPARLRPPPASPPTRPHAAPKPPPVPAARTSPPAPARPAHPPAPAHHPAPSTAKRASALAAAALGLAVTSLITLVLTAVGAARALANQARNDRLHLTWTLNDEIHKSGMMTPLVICLITSVLALILVSMTRRTLRPAAPVRTTRTLTLTAKALAVPALALAVLALVMCLVAAAQA
ncbi:caspase-related protein [Streptosporangium nondiastaticum]|uniref:Caspase-related protein n=1 Tax=Streptosporangium nondiastaticum TaxID=35764 RepID=A0A9X7JPA5_9ACTN|nr:caspase family protein [Streptosporangium nondiastaticum]PSJ27362.1 caspase-related protein [Streptosporangium nondiastaticum]